ncbi:hypothetical protein LXL04_021260 [Taraxacum kok-saghyz]
MHIFPWDTSLLFQKGLILTRIFPNDPATASIFDSSHAWSGKPLILIHEILSKRAGLDPICSTQTNHLIQMLLFALKTLAALIELNLMITCMSPRYLINEGKLQSRSKFFISPTRWAELHHSCTSFMPLRTMGGMLGAFAREPFATSDTLLTGFLVSIWFGSPPAFFSWVLSDVGFQLPPSELHLI